MKKERNKKRSRFSEEAIIGILREAEGESPVRVVCAKHNLSEATYYRWKKKHGDGGGRGEAVACVGGGEWAAQAAGGRSGGADSDLERGERGKNGEPVGQETGGARERGRRSWRRSGG